MGFFQGKKIKKGPKPAFKSKGRLSGRGKKRAKKHDDLPIGSPKKRYGREDSEETRFGRGRREDRDDREPRGRFGRTSGDREPRGRFAKTSGRREAPASRPRGRGEGRSYGRSNEHSSSGRSDRFTDRPRRGMFDRFKRPSRQRDNEKFRSDDDFADSLPDNFSKSRAPRRQNTSRDIARTGASPGSFEAFQAAGGKKGKAHVTHCDKCGAQCTVPFVPSGRKPVHCSKCYESVEKRGSRNFDRRRSDRGSFDRRGTESRSFDRRGSERRFNSKGFIAVCDKCGVKTDLPFEPRQGKPVYCRKCFKK